MKAASRDFCLDGLQGLARRVAAREATYEDIARHFLDRIKSDDGWLHAFVDVYEDEAIRTSIEHDTAPGRGAARGPLNGMPIAVKDLLDIRGKSTSAGSRARGGGVAVETSDVVSRLQDAGMTVLGKTHTVEYAFGGWGTNKWMGTPRNPWDPVVHRIPGGSSSGSAVAVAAGLAPCALGTDTGGSVRIPASLNGIVGLKPTKELVSTRGCFALSHSLDSIGPMTRTVADAEAMLLAMRDPSHAGLLNRPVRGALPGKVAVPIDEVEGVRTLDPDVRALYERTADMLRDAGVGIERVRLPLSLEEIMELSGRLVAFDAWRQHGQYVIDDSLPFDPYVRARILAGRHISQDAYARVQAARLQMSAQFADWIKDYSAVLLPTVPWPARAVDEVDQSGAEITLFTRLANFAHGCAVTLPVGLASSQLPVGMQLVGGPFADRTILALARLLEIQANFVQTHRIPLCDTTE